MSALGRFKFLLTGKAVWADPETNETVEETKEDWSTRWAIAGIHSANWRWVNRYGLQKCGCTINPITRRRVLYNSKCRQHCGSFNLED